MDQMLKKKIISLAVPATIENLLQTLVGFVDTLMISQIGLLAVTAVGVANTILSVYLTVFIALSVGASALISQFLGSKEPQKAQIIAAQSTLVAISIGLIFGLLTFFFGDFFLLMMGANEEVLLLAKQFFYIVGGASFLIALMTVFGSILRAAGDTKSPMKISVVVNLVNIMIDYLLIFGLGPIPALGVVGTAIGTVISRAIGCLLLYRKIKKSVIPFSLKDLKKEGDYLPLLRLSLPATMERLVMRMGQVVYFSLIVAIGAKTFAAHSIAGNVESFTYMPAYGLATAATTLIGNSIGAKNRKEANRIGYLTVKYGVCVLSICGVILFFGSSLFAQIFTKDHEAIQQIIIALRIDAFIQPALAASIIVTGALQGMGDTKSPLYSTAFGMWGLRIIGVILLGQMLGMGIAGIWVSIGLDLYMRSLYLIYRFRKNLSQLESSADFKEDTQNLV